MNRIFLMLVILFAVCGLAQADEVESQLRRPNILFAIADDWGWPHASAYGDPVCKTPTFDQVAQDGILFNNAFISSPSCTPSRNAILTGQHFWRLGGGANLHSVLDTKHRSFVHILEDAGYQTGHLSKIWGPGDHSNWKKHPGGKQYKYFTDFLKARDRDKPFCFCFGSKDPHRGYQKGSGKESGMDLDKIKLFGCFPDSQEIRGDVADYYFEVQRFDRTVGEAIKLLDKFGVRANTIIVVTGDHGMPFPRCKSNIYDSGSRVPMAVCWPGKIKSGRVVDDLVSTTDLAPTFLSAAGVSVPDEMTGQSWLPIFDEKQLVAREFVCFGKERHVPSQEAPDYGGYPMRAIRTQDHLLIVNFRPDRWPNGTPDYKKATIESAWLADTDNGPTKSYIVENREKDADHRRAWELCFGKRPRLELYDVQSDPEQLNNVAGDPKYAAIVKDLESKLMAELAATEDPRAKDSAAATEYFDSFKYLGSGPRHPSWKKKRKAKK